MAQICPKCNTENQDGALHCRRCGAALTPTAAPGRCPQCGADLLPDSQFCIRCGAPIAIAQAAPQTEGPTCPACGRAAAPGEAYCAHCGAPLSFKTVVASVPFLVGAIVTVAVSLCLIVGIWLLWDLAQEESPAATALPSAAPVAAVSPTFTPTITPTDTPTPTPTATPSPTPTSTPTVTPSPTPAPGPENPIAFVGGPGDDSHLYTINPDGSSWQEIPLPGIMVRFPQWSPDGQQFALEIALESLVKIWIVNADGSNPHPVAQGLHPAWSPDGRYLVFDRGSTGAFIIDLETGQERFFADDCWYPAWSPDGKTIACCSYSYGQAMDVDLIDIDGSHRRHLTRTPDTFECGGANTWSPDGQFLAVVSSDRTTGNNFGANSRLEIIDLTTGKRRKITDGQNLLSSAWSPDGRQLVFADNRGEEGTHLFLINTDGSSLRQLTQGEEGFYDPTWASPYRIVTAPLPTLPPQTPTITPTPSVTPTPRPRVRYCYKGTLVQVQEYTPPLISIRGKVINRKGKGVKGILVRVSAFNWYHDVRTGGDGSFIFDGLAQPIEWTISLPDYNVSVQVPIEKPGQMGIVRFEEKPCR